MPILADNRVNDTKEKEMSEKLDTHSAVKHLSINYGLTMEMCAHMLITRAEHQEAKVKEIVEELREAKAAVVALEEAHTKASNRLEDCLRAHSKFSRHYNEERTNGGW